jgi:hypothetical protein
MVALQGHELLGLNVFDLTLQVDNLLWSVAHHLYLPDGLGVMRNSHQYLMCLLVHSYGVSL